MDLQSIKLNIFKRLEYFLTIKNLNDRFNAQFNVLINRERKWDDDKKQFKGSAYPTWEIEKKILFWTYIYHKHLGREIKKGHLKQMFISDNEIQPTGIERIFENLALQEFVKFKEEDHKKCLITKEGLALGELLSYLYIPKNTKSIKSNSLKIPKKYTEVYHTEFELKRSLPWFMVFDFQLMFFYYIF